MDDTPTLFAALPVQRRALRHAERLLLLALPDHGPGAHLALVNRADEPTCRRLLKRELVVVDLVPSRQPHGRSNMRAARLPAALKLISE